MGQFRGTIELVVILGDPRNWKVGKDFSYKCDDGLVVVVETGDITDLASTPRIIWNIYPPFGLYTGAAIVHDKLYTDGQYSRARCDAILLEAMKTEGVSWITRTIIYSQVRMWGWAAWNEHRKEKANA